MSDQPAPELSDLISVLGDAFVPDIVETGILTPAEYAKLDATLRARLNRETEMLRACNGPDWLRANRDRLRDEVLKVVAMNSALAALPPEEPQ